MKKSGNLNKMMSYNFLCFYNFIIINDLWNVQKNFLISSGKISFNSLFYKQKHRKTIKELCYGNDFSAKIH